MKRRYCDHQRAGWSLCSVCRGRMHQGGCTSKRNPAKDCTQSRHTKLHNEGQTRGLDDSSMPMLGTGADD